MMEWQSSKEYPLMVHMGIPAGDIDKNIIIAICLRGALHIIFKKGRGSSPQSPATMSLVKYSV